MEDVKIEFNGVVFEINKKVVKKALKRLNKGCMDSFFENATESELDELLDVCNVIEDEMTMARVKSSGLWGSF